MEVGERQTDWGEGDGGWCVFIEIINGVRVGENYSIIALLPIAVHVHTHRSTHSHPENICSIFITMRGACSLLRGGDLTDKQHTKWNAHSHTFTQSSSTWAGANGTSSQTPAPRRAARRETSFLSSWTRHANQCKTVKQLQKETTACKSLMFLTRARSQKDGSCQSCAAASHSLLKMAAVRIDE